MVILDKDDPYDAFGEALPAEAPPSYDDVNLPSSSRPAVASQRSSLEKPKIGQDTSTRPAFGSVLPSSGPSRTNKIVPTTTVTPKVQADVRETVRGLVRNVIQGFPSGRISTLEALAILDSCATACMKNSLSFAEILQERSVEGHSAVYWSIVSRSVANGPNTAHGMQTSCLFELLSFAAPLSDVGVSEMRAACLALYDNSLLQLFRALPGLVPLLGVEHMLLAGSSPRSRLATDELNQSGLDRLSERLKEKRKGKDEAYAFEDDAKVLEGDNMDSFRVDVQLRMFQRRMRVAGAVSIEFISLSRLWLLVFFVVPDPPNVPSSSSNPTFYSTGRASDTLETTNAHINPNIPQAALEAAIVRKLTPGTWAVALGLLEGSVQCHAQARILIAEQKLFLTEVDLLSFNETDDNTRKHSMIVLNLTPIGSNPLTALPSTEDGTTSEGNQSRTGTRRARARRRRRQDSNEEGGERIKIAEKMLLAGLDASTSSSNAKASGKELMHDGCPYISHDGTLQMVLEAKLSGSAPGPKLADCIIC